MRIGARNNKLHNDSGFSLVELIVVIAIMAVLLGMISISLSVLFGSEAKQAYYKMNAELNDAKTSSMSRFDETLTLLYMTKNEAAGIDTDGYYCKIAVYTIDKDAADLKKVIGEEYRRIGSKKVEINAYVDGSPTPIALSTASTLDIVYDRSTGALKKANLDGSEHVLNALEFHSGLRSYKIVFVQTTGKHYLEK